MCKKNLPKTNGYGPDDVCCPGQEHGKCNAGKDFQEMMDGMDAGTTSCPGESQGGTAQRRDGDSAPRDPVPTKSGAIMRDVFESLRLIGHVHSHMARSHVHDCRKLSEAIQRLNGALVAMRGLWPK